MATGQPLLTAGARVAIVGGGTVGLLAARQCLDHGFTPTVFEKHDAVGGVWRQDEAGPRQHSPAYDSLYTNSSRTMMQISDFPFPFKPSREFPSRADICRYYEAYAKQFDLFRYVEFNTVVIGAEVGAVHADGSCSMWRVCTHAYTVTGNSVDGSAADEQVREFDALFICTGQFWAPKLPSLPQRWREQFEGTVIHSSRYRNASGMADRDCVVIGIGNSALDIALEVARAGARVTIVCRAGTTIIPVADDAGRPVDEVLLSRFFQSGLPRTARQLWFYLLTRGTNEDFRGAGLPAPASDATAQFSNLKEHRAFRKMLLSGRIRLRSGHLTEMQGRTLTFTGSRDADGVSFKLPCDVLICATGYKLAFPFLAPELERSFVRRERAAATGEGEVPLLQWLELYKYVMHTTHPTLCVFAIVNSLGNESLVGELQTRWALSVLSGRSSAAGAGVRPDKGEMERWVERRNAKVRRNMPKFAQFVPYTRYCDELSADIGCSPPPVLSWRNVLSPGRWPLLYKLAFAPVVQAQYRLRGPGKWNGAEQFLVNGVASNLARVLVPPPSRL